MTITIVHLDDIVLIGNYDKKIQRLNLSLAREFKIEDLGSLKYFLGNKVARSRHKIFLPQRK